jgi:hypothetical protein
MPAFSTVAGAEHGQGAAYLGDAVHGAQAQVSFQLGGGVVAGHHQGRLGQVAAVHQLEDLVARPLRRLNGAQVVQDQQIGPQQHLQQVEEALLVMVRVALCNQRDSLKIPATTKEMTTAGDNCKLDRGIQS